MNTIIRKKGRPATPINWPTSDFTVSDVRRSLTTNISKVSIQLRINSAVTKGILAKKTETRKIGVGRPSFVYSLIS